MSTSVSEPAEQQIAPETPIGRRDTILGVVGGAMVLFAIILLFVGGERDTGARAGAAPGEVPELQLLAPGAGDDVGDGLVLEFLSTREMESGSGGWGVGDLHIHLDIDGRSFMPGGRDITRLPGGGYRWTMPSLPPGEHTLRLYWAGLDHRALEEGASEPVRVVAR